ncbi:MAG: respiratory nitrate reductase subunit gamma [Nitrospinae bacterium]|nr:respiratory nitrate reductase subunit gamma [Nitrospinota bacterium]
MINILVYIVGAIFILGFIYKTWIWGKSAVPLRIVGTPGPKTFPGVILRIMGEVFLFKSLFRGNKLLWLGGWIFHIAFLFIILRHLRYFFYPVPIWIIELQIVGIYAGYIILIPLVYLLLRRWVVDRNRYISTPMDYITLFLIIVIAFTGILMKEYIRVDLVDVKAFILGLLTLQPSIKPQSVLFLIHFLSVLLLIVYFPFSKLMHAGGIFFSPTRNQRDNAREIRHVNHWNNIIN